MQSNTFYLLEHHEDSGFKFILHACQEEPEALWDGSVPAACEVHLTVLYRGSLQERHFFRQWPAVPQALDLLAGWAMWRMGARYQATCVHVLREDESTPSLDRGAEFLRIDGERPVAVASINLPWCWKAYALAWYVSSPVRARVACWGVSVPFDERTRDAKRVLCYQAEIPIQDGEPCFDALGEALREAVFMTECDEALWGDLAKRFQTVLEGLYV